MQLGIFTEAPGETPQKPVTVDRNMPFAALTFIIRTTVSMPHFGKNGTGFETGSVEVDHRGCLAFSLQIIWVMVPIGQKLHQVLGLNNTLTARPMMVEVSIRL